MKNRVYDMECCKCRSKFMDIYLWVSCDACGGKLKVLMERSTGLGY